MIKRGKLNLGQGVFRISAPNVDVDYATQEQLLLDERLLYPQLIQSIYVPFIVGQNEQWIPITNLGFVPKMYAFARYAGEDNRAFPAKAYYASKTGDAADSQNHFFAAIDAATLYVYFPIPTFLRGAQIITMRP